MKIQIRTLILDDDPTIAEFIESVLNKDHRFDISSFDNPDEFLRALNKDVQLVILDVNIPGTNYSVVNTIKYIKSLSITPDNAIVDSAISGIYIIVLSGYLSIEMMSEFMELEVFRAIEKGGSNDWMHKLDLALKRVEHKILYKLGALNEP